MAWCHQLSSLQATGENTIPGGIQDEMVIIIGNLKRTCILCSLPTPPSPFPLIKCVSSINEEPDSERPSKFKRYPKYCFLTILHCFENNTCTYT